MEGQRSDSGGLSDDGTGDPTAVEDTGAAGATGDDGAAGATDDTGAADDTRAAGAAADGAGGADTDVGVDTDEAAGDAADAAGDAADAVEDEGAEETADATAVDDSTSSAPTVKRAGVRRWFARHRRAVIVTTAATFIAAGAFAGAAVQPYLSDRATVATKLAVAETAAKAITTLWSYTPEDMDTLSERSAKYLGGGFEEQYRTYVDAIAATNRQAKVTSRTQVVGAAVESLRGAPMADEAVAIVYTNTTSTTPQNNNIPSLKYLSYRLELEREGRDWRVTRMTTVTSLDLTPKFGP